MKALEAQANGTFNDDIVPITVENIFLDENGKEHFVLPEEGDLIIMHGDLPHAPNHALKSTKDRIVFAGNVGFEMIKKEKSLL